MVAAEAAAAGCPPLVARHSGLAEVAQGLEAEYPPGSARPRLVRDGRRGRPAREARARCSRSTRRRVPRSPPRPAGPRSSAGAGRASPRGCSRPPYNDAPMGDEQSISPDELIDARARGVRGRDRLHRRRGGGVRAPRPGDARPHEPLRGGAGRGAGNRARGAPRRRADRVRGRDPHGPAGVVRGRSGRARRAPRAAARARRADGDRCSARPARTRGRTGRSSASSTRRTTGGTTSCCATSCGATTRSGSTCTSRSGAPTVRSRSWPRCATSCPRSSRSRRARRSSRT